MLLVVKNSPANAGDIRDVSSIPGLRRSSGGGHGSPLQYSCLENFHRQKSLEGYSPWGHKDLAMTEVAEHTCTSHIIKWFFMRFYKTRLSRKQCRKGKCRQLIDQYIKEGEKECHICRAPDTVTYLISVHLRTGGLNSMPPTPFGLGINRIFQLEVPGLVTYRGYKSAKPRTALNIFC